MTTFAPATGPQLKLARSLYAEYAQLMFASKDFLEMSVEHQATLREIHDSCTEQLETMNKQRISKSIDSMLGIVKKLREKHRIANAPAELESGIYLNNGTVYKVYRGQSGRMLAKELIVEDVLGGRFTYVGLATRFVKANEKMNLEQAKEFGAIYGVCCNCGRTLTNEESIEAGIGPVCAGKF